MMNEEVFELVANEKSASKSSLKQKLEQYYHVDRRSNWQKRYVKTHTLYLVVLTIQ
jgi:hypothetical protein